MENYPRFLYLCLPVLLGKSWSHCSGCVLPWVTAGSDWGTSFYWCGPLASELRTELLHFQCVLRRELLPSEWSPGRSPWLLGMLTWNSSLTTQTWDENFGSIGLPGRNWSHCLGSEVTASSIFLDSSLHAELGRRNRWWSRDHTSLLCSPGFIWYIGYVIIHLCRTLSWNNNKKY